MPILSLSIIVNDEAVSRAVKLALDRFSNAHYGRVAVEVESSLGFAAAEDVFDVRIKTDAANRAARESLLRELLGALPMEPMEIVHGDLPPRRLPDPDASDWIEQVVAQSPLSSDPSTAGISWSGRDIAIALSIAVFFVAILAVAFAWGAGSSIRGLQKAWPLLLIVATASVPVALLAALRRK
jgi:hypothetical protein